MGQYQDCKYSVFDPIFGEVKCKKRCLRLRNPKEECNNCDLYKKDRNKVLDIPDDDD